MVQTRLHTYVQYSLQDLIQRVKDDYYIILTLLSGQAKEYSTMMENTQLGNKEKLFFQINREWATELNAYIEYRNETILPYLQQLAEKEYTGHNCGQCSGKCDMQHTARIIEFTHTIDNVKGLYTSYSEKLSELREVNYSDRYKAIATTMDFLNEYAHQLWRIELDCVLPKMKMAQKNINAHS